MNEIQLPHNLQNQIMEQNDIQNAVVAENNGVAAEGTLLWDLLLSPIPNIPFFKDMYQEHLVKNSPDGLHLLFHNWEKAYSQQKLPQLRRVVNRIYDSVASSKKFDKFLNLQKDNTENGKKHFFNLIETCQLEYEQSGLLNNAVLIKLITLVIVGHYAEDTFFVIFNYATGASRTSLMERILKELNNLYLVGYDDELDQFLL